MRDAVLHASDISEWVALECWRYGRSGDTLRNPPTIIVSVRKDSAHFFHTAEQRVKAVLTQFGEPEVAILFMKDEILLCCERPELPPDACHEKVQPGVGLDIDESTVGSSTLGGLLQLRFLQESEWQTFAVSCFHCVYPPENHRQNLNQLPEAQQCKRTIIYTLLLCFLLHFDLTITISLYTAFEEWLARPIRPTDKRARKILRINHPSAQDLEAEITSWDKRIAGLKDTQFQYLADRVDQLNLGSDNVYVSEKEVDRYNSKKEIIEAYDENKSHFESFYIRGEYRLGSVFAGSGQYRARWSVASIGPREHPMMLDWALITVRKNRIGKIRYVPQTTTNFIGVALARIRALCSPFDIQPRSPQSPDSMTPGRRICTASMNCTKSDDPRDSQRESMGLSNKFISIGRAIPRGILFLLRPLSIASATLRRRLFVSLEIQAPLFMKTQAV